jgi:hypothetical protein
VKPFSPAIRSVASSAEAGVGAAGSGEEKAALVAAEDGAGAAIAGDPGGTVGTLVRAVAASVAVRAPAAGGSPGVSVPPSRLDPEALPSLPAGGAVGASAGAAVGVAEREASGRSFVGAVAASVAAPPSAAGSAVVGEAIGPPEIGSGELPVGAGAAVGTVGSVGTAGGGAGVGSDGATGGSAQGVRALPPVAATGDAPAGTGSAAI